jgi:hypothetical protein
MEISAATRGVRRAFAVFARILCGEPTRGIGTCFAAMTVEACHAPE